jgi:hypothetical protein
VRATRRNKYGNILQEELSKLGKTD